MSSTVVLASQPGSAVHDLRTKPWSTSLPMRQCGQTSETPLQTMRCHPRTPTPPRCNDSPQLSRLWFPVHSSSMGSRTVKLTASWGSGWSTALLRSGRWWQPCRKNSPAHCGCRGWCTHFSMFNLILMPGRCATCSKMSGPKRGMTDSDAHRREQAVQSSSDLRKNGLDGVVNVSRATKIERRTQTVLRVQRLRERSLPGSWVELGRRPFLGKR